MYKLFCGALSVFWVLDICNVPLMEMFDTTYPINFWVWLLIWMVLPSTSDGDNEKTKRGDVVLKTRYPKYINGVKQIQNPLHRLAVRVWYSDWFRMYFILIPLWMMPFAITLATLGVSGESVRNICVLLYLILCGAAMVFNDYTNLYRIGLDTDHNKIEVKDGEMH